MVKALLFDFWGTLADHGIKSPLRQAQWILYLSKMDFAEFVNKFETALMTKQFNTLEEGFKAVMAAFERHENFRTLNDLIGMWNKNWMLGKLYDDTIEVLVMLKEKGIKLALVSNTDSVSVGKMLEKYDLRKYFDVVALSCERGMLKSDSRMFETVLEELGVKAEDALMVGDSPETDIEPAKRAGLNAVLIDRRDKRPYEGKILTLREVENFI